MKSKFILFTCFWLAALYLIGCAETQKPDTAGIGSQSNEPSKPVPVCTSPASATVPLTAGPYFKENSPERSTLIQDEITGQKLRLSGFVVNTNCQPIVNARIETWQANAQGQYDNTGYTLRGHLFSDAQGYYQIETIVPGIYPGRTEHIHIKVITPQGVTLTTQLFFPDAAQNQMDSIFDPSLVLNIQENASGLNAAFNFILENR